MESQSSVGWPTAASSRASVDDSRLTGPAAEDAQRFWVARAGANYPCSEDAAAARLGGGSEGDIFGVWDGHGGAMASQFAAAELLPHAASLIQDGSAPAGALCEAHRRTETSFREFCWDQCSRHNQWLMAEVGACSLVVHLSEDRRFITTANAGDCRAVLGIIEKDRRSGGSGLVAEALSRDHNSREREEQLRMLAEHPDEPDLLFMDGPSSWYLKQRQQCTRSLGDFYLKEERFNTEKLTKGKVRNFLSPPYVQWEPEVQTRQVEGADAFMIIGTDGLWDQLGNQQAVDIAAQALRCDTDPADALVQQAMSRAAEREGMTLALLDKLCPLTGDSPAAAASSAAQKEDAAFMKRRHVHDDITVIVVRLHDGWMRRKLPSLSLAGGITTSLPRSRL
eukprot:TRINITY_DN13879_c0_g2_i1.p1 TRINITY_DN13879_c0_g2~~TRINITY_DN13879_c0_g2_i1.p1  ORF type:complete len:395 (-),score=75.05 TRINITY_DN13879_c0_g2_i1:645-1829(-)